MNKSLKVWVFTAKFPNKVQPWLANSIAQIAKLGSDIKIFSVMEGDKSYVNIVDEYALKDKTEYVKLSGYESFRQILSNFFNPNYTLNSIKGLLYSPRISNNHTSKVKKYLSFLTLSPFVVKQEIDIIHSHSEPAGYNLLPLVRSQSVPFIITFHGLPPKEVNQLTGAMRNEYTTIANAILVNTDFAKTQYINLGADAEKIRIIPQGIDTSLFGFRPKDYPKDGVVQVLTVGRYSKDKGQEYSIRAVADLINKGYSIKYTLIGEGINKSRLQQLVNELGISDVVDIRGSSVNEELIYEFQKAHIFILPSLSAINEGDCEETQGVTVQEAQACGAIVVATNTGGIPECVEDGVSAFLVEDRNTNAIANKVASIIDNKEKWTVWQTNARKHVEENYDINVIGNRVMKIYREVIEEYNGGR